MDHRSAKKSSAARLLHSDLLLRLLVDLGMGEDVLFGGAQEEVLTFDKNCGAPNFALR